MHIYFFQSYDTIGRVLQSFDVNDGPDFFNTQYTHQPTYATFPKPLH